MKTTFLQALLVGTRAALASVCSVFIAQAVNLAYPLYAVIAAVIVTDLSPEHTRRLGWQRLIGTAMGAFAGAALTATLGPQVWVIGVAILGMTLICHLSGYKDAAKLAAYVSALVLLDHSNAPWAYARDRFIETAIGIVLAIIMSWLIRRPGERSEAANASEQSDE